MANVGIPMLAYAWPAAWVLLVPVVALEAVVARWVLRAGWPASVKVAGLSNLVSTVAGIPLAWGAFLIVGSAVNAVSSLLPSPLRRWVQLPFHAAWLPMSGDPPDWVIPAAGAVLCLPFCLASVWVERMVAQRLGGFPDDALRRWAWRANLLSYALIALGLAIAASVLWQRGLGA